jgi:protease I
LLRHGAEVEVVSLRPGHIQGMNAMSQGKSIRVDRTLETAHPGAYDALLIPGGHFNPDFLRQSERALEFVRDFDRAGKPIAAICHAPWVLISAGLVGGRRLTSWPAIQDDVRNAGGLWEDTPVVRDGNWVSSRGPHDLPQFDAAIVELFSPGLVAPQRGSAVPLRTLALGGLALAALGYAVQRLGQPDAPRVETSGAGASGLGPRVYPSDLGQRSGGTDRFAPTLDPDPSLRGGR